MQVRNRRGGITPAEGCMFGAVGLFVILLLAILYIAFMRFRSPPPPTPVPAPAAAVVAPAPRPALARGGITPPFGGSSHVAPPRVPRADV